MPREQAIASLVAALGACLLVSCAPAGSQAERADPTTTTATSLVIEVPPPTDGSLRERIDGAGDRADQQGSDELDDPEHVLLVGDSVLGLVADDVARRSRSTLHVDAADCRRIDRATEGPCGGVPSGVVVLSGLDAIAESMASLVAADETPDVAVLVLANNSSLLADELDEAMTLLAGVERVWWVNARIDGFGRQDPNNAQLAALAARDDRARVIDWYAASEGRDLLADHVHPDDAGQRALASLIARHLRCDCTP